MRSTTFLLILFLTLLYFTGIAFAADVPSPDTDTSDWLKALYTAMTSGEYKIGAGLIMMGVVAAVMKWTPLSPKSKTGKIALAFAISLLSTLGVAFASGAPIAFATFATAISTAAGAAGVWGWVKDYMEHKDAKKAAAGSS